MKETNSIKTCFLFLAKSILDKFYDSTISLPDRFDEYEFMIYSLGRYTKKQQYEVQELEGGLSHRINGETHPSVKAFNKAISQITMFYLYPNSMKNQINFDHAVD